jgi:hypothetical protein
MAVVAALAAVAVPTAPAVAVLVAQAVVAVPTALALVVVARVDRMAARA